MFKLAGLMLALGVATFSAVVVDQANGVYTNVFADATGFSANIRCGVNQASGTLQLTNLNGGFTSPFNASGQATSTEIIPVSIAKWGAVTVDASTPMGTAAVVRVADDGGTVFGEALLPGNTAGFTTSYIDISVLPVTRIQTNTGNTKPARIFLTITLTTSDPSTTPTVRSIGVWWTVKLGDLSPAPIASTAWATPTGTSQATNQTPGSGAGQYPAIAWAKDIGQSWGGAFLRGVGDTIYFKHQGDFGVDGALIALNRNSGSTLWATRLSGDAFTTPDFTLSQNGTIYNSDIFTDLMLAFDANTGGLKWTHAFYAGHGNGEAAIGADGSIYTIRFDESPGNTLFVHAFSPDGSIKWTRVIADPTADGGSIGAGAISVALDGTLYFVSSIWDGNSNPLDEGMLYALDPANGSVKWTHRTGDSWLAPVVGAGGTVYVAGKQIFAVGPDGVLRWTYGGGAGWCNLALRTDGTLLAERNTAEYPAYSGAVDAIDAANGALLWTRSLNDDNLGGDALHIFFTDASGGFYRSATNYGARSSLSYHDLTGGRRWTLSAAAAGDVRFIYGMQDESGALYGDLYKDGLTNVFAVRPWTLTASTNATSYQPGSAVAFSVVTSMLPKNLLTGLPNQMQIVMDDGTKVAMTYRTATPDGDTVWSGAYSLPHSVSSGVHSYAVEANAAGITTDVPVHFNPSEVDSNGTGLVASGSFLVVTKGATVRVTSSQATSYFGRPVTLTATVTPAAPSSEVVFSDGPVRLGSAPLDARGRASFTTSALGVGSHYVFAACGNDSSNTVLQTVLPVPTATTLSSSADSAHVGQVATFTAIVSADVPGAGTPSGAVTFMDTGTTLISVALDATGRARYATSWLDAGSHQITAAYTGSANLAASESRRLVVNVRR